MEYPWEKALLVVLLLLGMACSAHAEVITRLPGNEKVVALTFDACETETPAHFDKAILAFLLGERIPFTLFVSGKFARRNAGELEELAKHPFVEIENHSLNHHQHMERLDEATIKWEVEENARVIANISGKETMFFRFPAGNYDSRTLQLVESLGFKVVHWTFPSGDPDRKITADKLSGWVLSRTKPGSILIFHINGRGYRTGEALPTIVSQLRKRGYRFVMTNEMIPGGNSLKTAVQTQ
jgi:peptidoglycan-N-acetylglucosamine deacetylase